MSDKKIAIKLSTLEGIGNALREQEKSTEAIPVNALADRIGALKIASGENKLAKLVERTITEITAQDLDGITAVAKYACYQCKNLINVTIPNSVTNINEYAFYECSKLTNLTIGDNVSSIGAYAFKDCAITALPNLNSLTTINNSAFTNCKRLTTVVIPDNIITISNSAFNGCSGITSVVIGNGTTKVLGGAFNSCTALKTVRIGNGITSMVTCFSNDTALTDIYIDKPENSISGSPWGATNAQIHWNTPLPTEEA